MRSRTVRLSGRGRKGAEPLDHRRIAGARDTGHHDQAFGVFLRSLAMS